LQLAQPYNVKSLQTFPWFHICSPREISTSLSFARLFSLSIIITLFNQRQSTRLHLCSTSLPSIHKSANKTNYPTNQSTK
jgi:hypothetical protein